MAVPFRRTSKTKKRMRRTHFKLAVTGVATCTKCGALIKAHHVCHKCGYYDGKQVVETKKKVAPEAKPTKAAKPVKAKKAAKEAKAEKVAETKVVKEKAPKAKKAAKAPETK